MKQVDIDKITQEELDLMCAISYLYKVQSLIPRKLSSKYEIDKLILELDEFEK